VAQEVLQRHRDPRSTLAVRGVSESKLCYTVTSTFSSSCTAEIYTLFAIRHLTTTNTPDESADQLAECPLPEF
jgi:hypothetical protein